MIKETEKIKDIIWSQQNATLEEMTERLKDMEIEMVDLGIETKEDAMKEIDKIEEDYHNQKTIRDNTVSSSESLGKVFLCFTDNNQSAVVPFTCSQELYAKYPNQTRVRHIEDCDTFAFVCYPKDLDNKDLNHIVIVHHDIADQLQKAVELKKRILPIRLWFTTEDKDRENKSKLPMTLINIDIKENEDDIMIGEIIPNWNEECIILKQEYMTENCV